MSESESEFKTGTGAIASDERQPQGRGTINFLRNSWAELQRVQWPDRKQVGQATAVVIGFVAIAGGYLGLIDAAMSKLVEEIL